MKKGKNDIYSDWKKRGILSVKLDFIKKASRSFYTQKKMCAYLGISEATFIKLKKNHPEVNDAINKGEEALLQDLYDATLLKAKGQTKVLHHRSAEKDPRGGQRQKLMEEEKYFPPDLEAIKYILMVKFGREYNPKKDLINIAEKKVEDNVWFDQSDDIDELDRLNELKKKRILRKMREELENEEDD